METTIGSAHDAVHTSEAIFRMRVNWRCAFAAVCVIAGIILAARIAAPIVMHRAAIRRLRDHGWRLSAVNDAPGWLPTWAAERTEGCWESARELSGPPRDADGNALHIEDLEELRWLPEVGSIELADLPDPDLQVQALRNCRGLRMLSLTGPGYKSMALTDAGISALRELRQLEVLNLSRTQVTDTGIAGLRGLTLLKGLSLSSTTVTGAGFADWRGRDIEWLVLDGTQMTDDNTPYVARFPKLQRLVLDRTPISDSGLDPLLALAELEELSLNDTAITSAGASRLAGMIALRTISLNSTSIDDRAIADFADRLGVTDLAVGGTQISDVSIAHFVRMDGLRQLILSETSISGSAFSQLANCANLRRLAVDKTAITAESLKSILFARSIEQIEIADAQLKDAEIAELAATELGRKIIRIDPDDVPDEPAKGPR